MKSLICVFNFLLCLLQLTSSAIEMPSVALMNAARPGMKMPVVGIGTGAYIHESTGVPGEIWNDTIAEKYTMEWLAMGGRRVDNALKYLDEIGVGRAVRNSGIPREEIFLTSKILLTGYNETFSQMNQILSDLKLDYVDLLLAHYPKPISSSTDPACQQDLPSWRGCRQSVWKAMEILFNSGKAHAIGVSNFEQDHVEDIIMMDGLIPSVNQVEYQPYWHENDLLQYCKSKNIVFNGYSSLGTPDWAPYTHKWNGTILELPLVQSIAKVHDRTAAQVLLKWAWQQGVVVNPRSMNTTHMKENLNFFNFELSEDEMKQISTINPPANPKVCPDFHNVK